MKRLCFIALAILCLGIYQETYAAIRNGYDIELIKAEKWMHNLKAINQEVLSTAQRMALEERLKTAHATLKKFRKNQAKTQELIEMLRMIDPDLYHEINTIKDCEGTETDVYIKVVDDLGPDLRGATNVHHSDDNPNVYSSEYGDYSVSIRLITTGPIRPIWILAHELGHVRYQVPHLAEYTAFFQKVYSQRDYKLFQIGHHVKDPSHQSVKETMKTFKKSWKAYNRKITWMAKNKSRKTLASIRAN